MKNSSQQSGFIKLIVIIVVIVIILSWIGFDLRQLMESELVKNNFQYLKEVLLVIWEFLVNIWNKFLAEPTIWIWDNIIIDLFWHNIKPIPEMLNNNNS
ncbi:MAG: hypothetical protein ACOCU8_00360 [Patescibacteria group bacterium]